jgi:hypothetical protein
MSKKKRRWLQQLEECNDIICLCLTVISDGSVPVSLAEDAIKDLERTKQERESLLACLGMTA